MIAWRLLVCGVWCDRRPTTSIPQEICSKIPTVTYLPKLIEPRPPDLDLDLDLSVVYIVENKYTQLWWSISSLIDTLRKSALSYEIIVSLSNVLVL